MQRKRRNKAEQAEMVMRITELRERGWSQMRIARKLGDINRDMVGHYCRLYNIPTTKTEKPVIEQPETMDFSNEVYHAPTN